jgi:hypothetical protein
MRPSAGRSPTLIAHSPLVKTAFFASDPNWGRISWRRWGGPGWTRFGSGAGSDPSRRGLHRPRRGSRARLTPKNRGSGSCSGKPISRFESSSVAVRAAARIWTTDLSTSITCASTPSTGRERAPAAAPVRACGGRVHVRSPIGAVLVARRPEHVHQGGCGSFLGGKVKHGRNRSSPRCGANCAKNSGIVNCDSRRYRCCRFPGTPIPTIDAYCWMSGG